MTIYRAYINDLPKQAKSLIEKGFTQITFLKIPVSLKQYRNCFAELEENLTITQYRKLVKDRYYSRTDNQRRHKWTT